MAGWREPCPDGRRQWQDAIGALLDTEDAEVLFVAGCEENQARFDPRFDHTVLLSTPTEILIERLPRGPTIRTASRPNSCIGCSSAAEQRHLMRTHISRTCNSRGASPSTYARQFEPFTAEGL